MHSFFIALTIPTSTQELLSRHCFGLAQVTWLEKSDLFIQLQKIEIKNQGLQIEIEEQLAQIDSPPFSLSVQGIYAQSRKGELWAGITENPALTKLNQSILKCLKEFDAKVQVLPPKIALGYFQGLSEERLANYLEAHALFFRLRFKSTFLNLSAAIKQPKGSSTTACTVFPCEAELRHISQNSYRMGRINRIGLQKCELHKAPAYARMKSILRSKLSGFVPISSCFLECFSSA